MLMNLFKFPVYFHWYGLFVFHWTYTISMFNSAYRKSLMTFFFKLNTSMRFFNTLKVKRSNIDLFYIGELWIRSSNVIVNLSHESYYIILIYLGVDDDVFAEQCNRFPQRKILVCVALFDTFFPHEKNYKGIWLRKLWKWHCDIYVYTTYTYTFTTPFSVVSYVVILLIKVVFQFVLNNGTSSSIRIEIIFVWHASKWLWNIFFFLIEERRDMTVTSTRIIFEEDYSNWDHC